MGETSAATGFVTGGVRQVLRLEGLALFVAATTAYFALGHVWWLYLLLILAPDLSFLGYLGGSRVGAIAYNAVHTTVGPIVLATLGLVASLPLATTIALIWAAHIGIDRAVGYGLKYEAGPRFTHLGSVGRPA